MFRSFILDGRRFVFIPRSRSRHGRTAYRWGVAFYYRARVYSLIREIRRNFLFLPNRPESTANRNADESVESNCVKSDPDVIPIDFSETRQRTITFWFNPVPDVNKCACTTHKRTYFFFYLCTRNQFSTFPPPQFKLTNKYNYFWQSNCLQTILDEHVHIRISHTRLFIIEIIVDYKSFQRSRSRLIHTNTWYMWRKRMPVK